MTKRKRKRRALKRLRRQAVEVHFDGGTLTSDGGLSLLREVDQRLNLIPRLAEAIPDPRDPLYTSHTQQEILTSRIFGIAAGYEDANDHQTLRHDPAFQVAAGRTPAENDYSQESGNTPLASPSTHSRFENRITSKEMFTLHEILVDTFLDSHDEPPEEIILRGDSGYAIERLMRWCDKNAVGYVFGLQKNPVLEREITCEMTRARISQSHRGGKQSCFKWFRYRTSKSWDRHRWVVGKAQYTCKGANPRFVVTNLFDDQGIVDATHHRPLINGRQVRQWKHPGYAASAAMNPETFYRQIYCARGEMENRIKEQQMCLFADRTSCSRFMANRFRLLLSSFAYVLIDGLRRLGLSRTEQARWRVDTIRLRLLKIAARVKVTCRRVVFHLCSHCPWASVFDDVMDRLCRSD
ncbi:MAG: transposase [Planctomycetota bacterium]